MMYLLCIVGLMMTDRVKSQADKYKQAARELKCDRDAARWDENLELVSQQSLAQEMSE